MRKLTHSLLLVSSFLVIFIIGCDSQISAPQNEETNVNRFSKENLEANVRLATPASASFTVIYGPGNDSDGNITISYEGDNVVTQYFSGENPIIVASRIRANVNADSNIQLTASVLSGGSILLTEKRAGSEYNGNNIALIESPDLYLIPNQPNITLSGGTD